ncbi:prolipoprotein diacylglyceryl transferase [Candidatus Roizmanbacteria bacterium]|nr:prolipoprotein diacylglyceryl transferase [Candidatus Roizmanbacteria bacterium]
MLPVLLDLKFIKIYTFGVFLVLAFFWGAFLLWKNFLLTSFKEEEVFDGVFISLGGGLFLSRLTYVILHFDKFGFSILKFILINGYPGLSLYGFLFGSLLSLYLYLLFRKLKFTEAVDYFIPAVFLALGFGKLGSFFSGVEVGTKTRFFLSIKYVGADGLRNLTPLYESLLLFAGAYIAYKILFAIRRETYPKGFNFSFFVLYFAIVSFVFDFLKASPTRLFGFSFNALVSLFLLLTFTFYFLYYFRSSIFGWFGGLSNFISRKYEQKLHKNLSHKAAKRDRKGEREPSVSG